MAALTFDALPRERVHSRRSGMESVPATPRRCRRGGTLRDRRGVADESNAHLWSFSMDTTSAHRETRSIGQSDRARAGSTTVARRNRTSVGASTRPVAGVREESRSTNTSLESAGRRATRAPGAIDARLIEGAVERQADLVCPSRHRAGRCVRNSRSAPRARRGICGALTCPAACRGDRARSPATEACVFAVWNRACWLHSRTIKTDNENGSKIA